MFEEGGATWAAADATCARVLMCVVGLVGVMALRSRDACHLHWRLHLDDSSANVVGLLLNTQPFPRFGLSRNMEFETLK